MNLLKLGRSKNDLPTLDSTFVHCKHDGKKVRKNDAIKGLDNNDLYCSEGCLKAEEGQYCWRGKKCPNYHHV